jgi:DNA-binding CsgD family transcriptional regulator
MGAGRRKRAVTKSLGAASGKNTQPSSSGDGTLRVVLAGGRWLRRRALEQRLSLVPGVLVLRCVPTVVAALSFAARHRVQVLVVGDELLDDRSIARLRIWKRRHAVRIVAVVPEQVLSPLLLVDAPIDGLISLKCEARAVARALGGQAVHTTLSPGLSRQEQTVVRHTIEGLSLKQMAELLGCRVQSVHNYRRRAMDKLDVSSLAELGMRYGRQMTAGEEGETGS